MLVLTDSIAAVLIEIQLGEKVAIYPASEYFLG